MARKPSEDLLSPLTLIVGQEELLLDRAVAKTVAAARADDPDTDVRDLAPGTLQPGMLSELTSPSLFSERKVIVVRAAQDVGADVVKELKAYIEDPAPDVLLLLVHAGGVKGKALLEAGKKAGAREVACAKVAKPAEKLSFVRAEFRSAGRSASEDACRALLDAVGGDLRELASAASQLAADTEGTIDETVVARYYTGRAESTGFQVADLAVAGRTADALGQLRWALAVGEKPTGIVFALASGVRAIGRVATADRSLRPADLARELGMPPWKIDRVRQQMRGWSGDGVARALQAIAQADAAVKGGSGDPAYALEQCVVAVSQAARAR